MEALWKDLLHEDMWTHSVNTLSLDVELLQRQTCYCGQIGESSLLCGGAYMEVLYKHIEIQRHSADK